MFFARTIVAASSRARRRAAFLLPVLLLCVGCGNGGGTPARGEGPGPGERQGAPPVAVAVAPPERGEIASYYTANASLDPNKEAEVVARVSGVVLELAAEEGDLVQKGDLLLRIEESEYRHRLSQTEAEASKVKARFDRLTKMVEGDLISAEEFEETRSDLMSAEAAKELAALELSYARVRSPFRGRVVRRYVDPGQMVSEGTALFQVADVSVLLSRVHVPAKEFRNIRTDQTVELRVDSSDEVLQGEITLVSPIIDPATGTIKVTVEVTDYPGSIRPGDFAEVRIVTDRHENTLLVPKTAVISEKGEDVVYLAVEGVAERRVVQAGFRNEEFAEIISGLAGGESVVVQGQRSLREGQPVKILEPMAFDRAEPARDDS